MPLGQDAKGVLPGDFILCHRKGLASTIIRWGTRGVVSHGAFCESSDTLVEALTRGVVRSPLSEYRHVEYWIVRTGLTGTDQEQAVAFARSCVGQEYGWAVNLGLALRYLGPGRGLWFGANGTENCSGLIGQTQVRGWVNYPWNPASCSPVDLFDFYSRQD